MKKLKNFPGLAAHRAQNEKEAAELAVRGDIASILEGIVDHPPTAKQYLDLLHKEHPLKAGRNAAGLLRILMTGYIPDKAAEIPANLKAAKQALIAGHPEQTLAYVAKHPEELANLCKGLIGFTWEALFRTPAEIIRSRQAGKDNLDMITELVRYLAERNKAPLFEVRGRITTLLEVTEKSETEDRETEAAIEKLEKNAVLVLNNMATPRGLLRFRRVFRNPKGNKRAAIFQAEREFIPELKEDLWIEARGDDGYTVTQEDLEAIATPLTRTGISVKYGAENKTAKKPGWIKAKKEDINAALTSQPPKLVLHKISDDAYEIRQSPPQLRVV